MVSADRSRVTLRLSVPYATRWGQMLRVVGDGPGLGNGQADAAPELACRHVGDRLLWVGEVTVPRAAAYSYKYVVVGEGGNVEDEELSARELRLPADLAAGAVVEVHDEWQVLLSDVRLDILPARANVHALARQQANVSWYCEDITGNEGSPAPGMIAV